MNVFKQNLIPIIALIITGTTALLAYDHLFYVIPYVVFKYPLAIIVVYIFFRFIAFSDRRRSAQLDEVGLLRPMRDGAFLFLAHVHLLDLGADLNILSSASSVHVGLLSWAVLLTGHYAVQQPQGLLGRLVDILPGITPTTRAVTCHGFIIAGILGVIGTFTATLQPLWLCIPLLLVFIWTRKRSGDLS